MKLLLVDGHYYLYRSFFAIRNLKNPQGQPTNALYGIAKALRRMIAELSPDRVVVVMDGGLPQARLDLQPEYKANRPDTPDELASQFPLVQPMVEAMGFSFLCIEGEEADDVIATLATQAAKEVADVFIATSDKDIMQLVCERIKIYQPDGETFKILGAPEVEQKWGVPPEKIGDILTLTGDSSDNIPGLPGVGPKTAAAWIIEYGSVDQLVARRNELKNPRHQAMIEQGLAQIESNRGMVKLNAALPLPLKWNQALIRPNYPEQVKQFRFLNFKSMLAEAEKHCPAVQTQGELF